MPTQAALGAVDFLVWLGMADAMTRGRRFDFDGVSSPSRLRFLQSFGGQLSSRIVVTRRSLRLRRRVCCCGVCATASRGADERPMFP